MDTYGPMQNKFLVLTSLPLSQSPIFSGFMELVQVQLPLLPPPLLDWRITFALPSGKEKEGFL